ncbi:SPFH domain-containing protein [Sphingomonas sp. MMS24-JH45]
MRATAESAMRAVLATTTLNEAIGAGRTNIEAQVTTAMQEMLDTYQAGVRIQGVSIKQAAAPASLIDDFNNVTAAQQQAVGDLNNARSYAQQVIARAQGEAAAFDKVYAQYRLAPEVTRRRMSTRRWRPCWPGPTRRSWRRPGVAPLLPIERARRLTEPTEAQTAPAQAPAPQPSRPGAGGRSLMPAILRHPIAAGFAALFAVILAAATFAIVPETMQAVVLRLNNPIRIVNQWQAGQVPGNSSAGVIARVPFIDKIVWIDKRVLDADLDNTLVLSTDQLRLNVDAFARFPHRRSAEGGDLDRQHVDTEERVADQLAHCWAPRCATSSARCSSPACSRPTQRVMDAIQSSLQRDARQYGVEIVDMQ